MTTILAHKIEIKPTPEQVIYFKKACGTARFAYNWGLERWQSQYKNGQKPSWMGLKKELNSMKQDKFPWMYEVTKCAPEGALANLGVAFSNFFKDCKKKSKRKSLYPQRKKKGKSKDSFYLSNDQFSISGNVANLPHIKNVRMTEELRYQGRITSGTVSRCANKWFLTIQVEVSEEEKEKHYLKSESKASVGIDLGIKTAVVLSNGKTFNSPNPLNKNLKMLARLNRRLHKKMKGSQRRFKAREKVAKLHARIANIRQDWTHKVTTEIVRKYGVICLEDLNVSGMVQNEKLSRAISDVGFGEFTRQLTYKSELKGCTVKKVDRFFPSSKQCRICGVKNQDLTLSDRVFVCGNADCKHTEDRDLHASRNILKEGKSLILDATKGHLESDKNARGQEISTPKRKRFGSKSLGRSEKQSKLQECVGDVA